MADSGSGNVRKRKIGGSVSRRDFLRVGGLSVVGLSLSERKALARLREKSGPRNCILVLMTGGPSQFETFDPKPDAPSEIRGPLKSIATAIPGVAFSETLPGLAQRAGRFTTIRSLYHDAAPIHETGFQLLQTGRLNHHAVKHPAFGSVAAKMLQGRGDLPASVVLPRPLHTLGTAAGTGQTAGFLGEEFSPYTLEEEFAEIVETPPHLPPTLVGEQEPVRRAYGDTRCGRLLLRSRQLVECGVRCVTVNLFDTLAGQVTWDCHGRSDFSSGTLFDYRDELCPAFDRAMSALLDDLEQRGLLDETLVVACGEFGRTPRVNAHLGRDHWTSVFSGLLAGAGVPGGEVIGASDRQGAAPADRPVHLGELHATMLHALRIESTASLSLPDGSVLPVSDHDACVRS
ncbi:MAG: DUF1501 domain-containing protein [Planctomycetaceae bacterium]